MKRVAVVYHYIALYRVPIFGKMAASNDVNYTILAGESTDIPIEILKIEGINSRSFRASINWRILKNRWILNKRLLWQSGLLSTIWKEDYDAVIFLGSPYHLTTWFASLLLRLRGRRVYFWMHGLSRDQSNFKDYFKLLFYRMATGYFLYGNRAAKLLAQRLPRKRNEIHVIFNSLNYFESLRRRVDLSEDDYFRFRTEKFGNTLPVIVFIGRLNIVKRIDLLLRAQAESKDHLGVPRFNVLIIGDGSELDNLVSLAQKMELKNFVHFTGALYKEEDISGLMALSDICVTPGEIGLTAIHSLSYGTPAISHDNLDIQMPEVEALIDGITGKLYKYGDVNSLRDTIETWLQKHPVKSKEVTANCYLIIDRYYNPEVQIKKFNSVLDKDETNRLD